MKRFILGLLIIFIFLCVLVIVFASTNTGLRTVFNIVKWTSNGELSTSQIDGRLIGGNIQIKNLRYHDKEMNLSIANIKLDWKPAKIFSGRLFIYKLSVDRVDIEHKQSSNKPQSQSKAFSLPMAITIKQAGVNHIKYQSGNDAPLIIQNIQIALTTKGNTVDISKFHIKAKPNSIDLSGSLGLSSPYKSNIKGQFENSMGSDNGFAGHFSFSGDLKDQIIAEIVSDKPVQLNIHAKLNKPLDNGTISVKGSWNQFTWALAKNNIFHSTKGEINIEGHIDKYTASLKTEINGTQLPKTQLNLLGNGSLKNFTITEFSSQIFSGIISAKGKISWNPYLSWNVTISGKHLNPQSYWPKISAQLNFNLESVGTYNNKILSTTESLKNLFGTYNQQPISGRMQFSSIAKNLNISNFNLSLGKNHLSIKGHFGATNQLSWKLNIQKLHEFYPLYKGMIKTSGQLTGQLKKPKIKANLDISNFATPEIGIQKLHLQGAVNTNFNEYSHFYLSVHKLAYKQFKIKQAYLSVKGNKQKHHIYINLKARRENLYIDSRGEIKEKAIHELITQLTLTSKHFGHWKLNKPIDLTASKDSVHISHFCWQADSKHYICGKPSYIDSKQWTTAINILHFNLGIFNVFLPSDWQLNTDINSQLQLSGNDTGPPKGYLKTVINHFTINHKDINNTESFSIRKSNINITANKQGISSQANIRVYKNTRPMMISFSLPGYHLFNKIKRRQKINGTLNLDWESINQFSQLSPYISKITGSLVGKLALSGTIKKPILNGKIALENGSITNSQFGLALTKIGINLALDSNTLKLTSSLHSGPGILSIAATSNLSKPLDTLKAHISGSNIQVMNTKEYKIEISPDINISYAKPEMLVTGKIDIPLAIINPKNFSSVITLPSNFIIVSKNTKKETSAFQPVINLTVTLGDKINVQYSGLTAKLGGSITINSKQKSITTATGKIYVIKGGYDAYGKKLTIKRGIILFTGGDISNPGLNILATKSIQLYDFSGAGASVGDAGAGAIGSNITVGVLITGTADSPKISIYSEPPMSQTDALSYLLFGKPSSSVGGASAALLGQSLALMASGKTSGITNSIQDKLGLSSIGFESTQVYLPGESNPQSTTSFVVGKQITKRLKALYTVGIAIPVSILMLQYKISSHWRLQTQTSNFDNGADIIYTIQYGH